MKTQDLTVEDSYRRDLRLNSYIGNGSIEGWLVIGEHWELQILQANNRYRFCSLDFTTSSTDLLANCRKNSTKSR